MGIPWMLAFALRADGWYLRQDIIWSKPNPMPESIRDRCTKAHEYVFLLSKSARYYYDAEAIKEPATYGSTPTGVGFGHGTDKEARQRERVSNRNSFARKTKTSDGAHGQKPQHREGRPDIHYDLVRNKRSVWQVTTRGYKGAHFATFPPALIEPCILAGCPVGGVVLDPFGGSGTTAGVAVAHGRRAVLCELNSDYADLVPGRVESILAGYGKKQSAKKRKQIAPAEPACAFTLDLLAGVA